jgi:hypothetical protein
VLSCPLSCQRLVCFPLQVCLLDSLRYVLSDAQHPDAHTAVVELGGGNRLLPLLVSLLQKGGLSDAAAAAAVSAAAVLRAVLARRGPAPLVGVRSTVVGALVQLLLSGPRSDYAVRASPPNPFSEFRPDLHL